MSNKQIAIHPLTLIPNHRVGFDVSVLEMRTKAYVKFLNANEPLSKEKHNQLAMLEGQNCYIPEEAIGAYRVALESNLGELTSNNRVSDIIKLATIFEHSRLCLSDALDSLNLSIWINTSIGIAKEFDSRINTLLPGKIEPMGRNILFAMWKEGTFLNHSFNVGFYCYQLAKCLQKKLGIELDPIECMVGGILHDTGKLSDGTENGNRLVSPEGCLESSSIKKPDAHPTVGFNILARHPAVTKLPLLACYQHHERSDGNGFPVGLFADQIPIGSSICGVANRWDGLLAVRNGTKGTSRVNAIQLIQSEQSIYWNTEVVQCLVKLLN